MITIIQAEVNQISQRFEIMFNCTGSLRAFGELDLEIEQITNLQTNEVLDFDAEKALITPEIEEALKDHFRNNYDPTPYE